MFRKFRREETIENWKDLELFVANNQNRKITIRDWPIRAYFDILLDKLKSNSKNIHDVLPELSQFIFNCALSKMTSKNIE